MATKLIPIFPDQLEATRPIWFPFVESIAKRQRCYVEQRLVDVYSGTVALVLIWDAEKHKADGLIGYSILTRGPDRVAKLVWTTGEDSESWIHLFAPLEEFFRNMGCVAGSALARPGWGPFLKSKGYRITHIEFEKEYGL